MKNVFGILFLGLVMNVGFSSEGVKLKDGDTYLSAIEEVKLVKQEALCKAPIGHEGTFNCFVDGTVVYVDIPVGGCMDHLAQVFVHAEEDLENDVLNVYVGGSIILNSYSLVALCSAIPAAQKQFTFINKYGDVKIHVLPAM